VFFLHCVSLVDTLKVYLIVRPKTTALKEATDRLQLSKERLQEAASKLEAAETLLAGLVADLRRAEHRKEDITQQVKTTYAVITSQACAFRLN
jgi:hypothetical protein